MKAEGESFSAVLPKPKKSLKSFQYYIDVTDRAFATSRTPEHTAEVTVGPAACEGKMVASAAGSASILLEVPAGAPATPAGFSSAGLAAAGAGAGVAAGAAAGGGIGAGAVAAIVGGGAAVAGAAVAVSKAGGGDEGDGGGGDGGERPTFYSVTFAMPGIDVSVCVGRPLGWCCQNVNPDSSGRFDTVWSPMDPNTARITGTVTDTAFNATIACTSGAASGALSATGSGGSYSGTFTFGSQRGAITVTRVQQ